MKFCMSFLRKNKIPLITLSAVAFLLLTAVFGLLCGATELGISDLFRVLLQGDVGSVEGRILWYVRFPRVLAGMLCGAALSLSGAVIQGVLANGLASPSVVGVNAGAGLAVTVCAAFGILGGWRLSLSAFLGAFLAVLIVSFGAKKWGASRGTVILMGVALNALFGAVSDTVTTLSPTVAVLSNDFKMGDLSSVTYAKLLPAGIVILLAAAVLLLFPNELDLLSFGDENAKGLGLNVGLVRVFFLLLAALLAGAAVSVAGLLSFVGLLVPHAVRRTASASARHLLPLCGLLGGGFVTLCDTFARTLFAPYELPVGILMAFLGAPFFLFILIKGKGGVRGA